MRTRFLSAFLLVALAACGEETPDASAAAAESAADPAEAFSGSINPGRWKVESTLADGTTQTEYACILPEQATSGSFFRGEMAEGCTTERDEIANGRIDLALSCDAGGQSMFSIFTGTYDATSYRTATSVDLGSGEPMRATSVGTFESDNCQPDDTRLTVN